MENYQSALSEVKYAESQQMKKTLPSFPVHLLSQLRYFLGVYHSLPKNQQINPPKAEWA